MRRHFASSLVLLVYDPIVDTANPLPDTLLGARSHDLAAVGTQTRGHDIGERVAELYRITLHDARGVYARQPLSNITHIYRHYRDIARQRLFHNIRRSFAKASQGDTVRG